MNWQDDYPTKPGWYWKFSKWDEEPEIVKVRKYNGKMCILNWELPAKTVWAGPIQEPVES